MSDTIDFKALAAPFHPQDIEWRLQECGKKGDKIWAMCLAYITNRAIMQRLDDVCGPNRWKNRYRPGPHGGVVCGISIKCDGEWVEKWDGADNTQIEATKGGLSDSMKRAGVQWGIGRYLYNLDVGFANICKEGEKGEYRGKVKEGNIWFSWNPPKLPTWALPEGPPEQENPQKEAPPLPDQSQQGTQEQGKAAAQSTEGECVSPGMIKTIRASLNKKDVDEGRLLRAFKVEAVEQLKKSAINDILAWINGEGQS